MIFKQVAVELVGAGAGDEFDRAARIAPVFGLSAIGDRLRYQSGGVARRWVRPDRCGSNMTTVCSTFGLRGTTCASTGRLYAAVGSVPKPYGVTEDLSPLNARIP